MQDSVKDGKIQSMREENRALVLKLSEIQDKEARTSNEVRNLKLGWLNANCLTIDKYAERFAGQKFSLVVKDFREVDLVRWVQLFFDSHLHSI